MREAVAVGEGEGLEEGEDPREELGVAVGVEEWDAEKVAFELLVTVCMLVQDWETLAVGERETLDDEGVAVGVSERDSDTEGDFDWDTDAV